MEAQTQQASCDWIDRVFSRLRVKLQQAQETGRFGSCGVTVTMRDGSPAKVEFAESFTEPALIGK